MDTFLQDVLKKSCSKMSILNHIFFIVTLFENGFLKHSILFQKLFFTNTSFKKTLSFDLISFEKTPFLFKRKSHPSKIKNLLGRLRFSDTLNKSSFKRIIALGVFEETKKCFYMRFLEKSVCTKKCISRDLFRGLFLSRFFFWKFVFLIKRSAFKWILDKRCQ